MEIHQLEANRAGTAPAQALRDMRFCHFILAFVTLSANFARAEERVTPRVTADAEYKSDRGAQVSGSSLAPRANTMSGTISMWLDPSDGSAELAIVVANDGILVPREGKRRFSKAEVEEFRRYIGDAPKSAEGSPRTASAEARTDGVVTETRGFAAGPADHVVFQFTYTYDPSTELAMASYSRASKADSTAQTEAIYVPRSEFSPRDLWSDYVQILRARNDKAPMPPLYRELDGKWITYFLSPSRAEKAGFAKAVNATTWSYKGWTYYPQSSGWYRQVVNKYNQYVWEKWEPKAGAIPFWQLNEKKP